MDKIVLQANVRDIFGKKLAESRKAGQLPGILYGNKKDNQPITVSAQEFERVFNQAGQSTLVELKLDGGNEESVLIQDVHNDPVTGSPTHVDLYRVDMNKTIRTEVPLHFVGESPAVFQDEGSLLKNIEEVEVETLPGSLPANIEVDISGLDDFSKSIHVSDLKVPEGVEVLVDGEEMICKVEPPRSEEEIAALEEEVGDAIPEGAEEGEEGAEGEEAAEGAEGTEGEAKEGGEAPAADKKPEAKE